MLLQIETDLKNNSQFTASKLPDRVIYLSNDTQIKQDLEGNTLVRYLKTTPGRILLNQAFK